MLGLDPGNGDLGGPDAAQLPLGHGHIGGKGKCRQQLTKLSSLLVNGAVGGKGRLSQNRVKFLALLDAHGGSPLRLALLTWKDWQSAW
ncbi:hypothetical protein Afe04nite_75850 [Asanoa ferruginea]|nr:hypothetical protein Afe04nite_75850 [Asanoa ferruginea]